jgi:hypothetical protein
MSLDVGFVGPVADKPCGPAHSRRRNCAIKYRLPCDRGAALLLETVNCASNIVSAVRSLICKDALAHSSANALHFR